MAKKEDPPAAPAKVPTYTLVRLIRRRLTGTQVNCCDLCGCGVHNTVTHADVCPGR